MRDNIALPLELAREVRKTREARVRSVMELVGLAEFAGNYPAQLSGGMRMRVSLARAVVTDPELLLLDEPFAALDDITRQTLNEELLALWRARHWTGVFVTHNIAEAVFLSQRVLVLTRRPGRIAADIPIPFPFPRTNELRAQPEFARLTGEVAARLHSRPVDEKTSDSTAAIGSTARGAVCAVGGRCGRLSPMLPSTSGFKPRDFAGNGVFSRPPGCIVKTCYRQLV